MRKNYDILYRVTESRRLKDSLDAALHKAFDRGYAYAVKQFKKVAEKKYAEGYAQGKASSEAQLTGAYREGYEIRRAEESKNARMVVDSDSNIYKTALEDAWKVCCRVVEIWGETTISECRAIFGYSDILDIFSKCSLYEIMRILEGLHENGDLNASKILENLSPDSFETERKISDALEHGRDEAWDAIKTVIRNDEVRSTLGTHSLDQILDNYTATEVVEKVQEYKDKEDEKCKDCIHLGEDTRCLNCKHNDLFSDCAVIGCAEDIQDDTGEPESATIQSDASQLELVTVRVGDELESTVGGKKIVVSAISQEGYYMYCIDNEGFTRVLTKPDLSSRWRPTGNRFDVVFIASSLNARRS